MNRSDAVLGEFKEVLLAEAATVLRPDSGEPDWARKWARDVFEMIEELDVAPTPYWVTEEEYRQQLREAELPSLIAQYKASYEDLFTP